MLEQPWQLELAHTHRLVTMPDCDFCRGLQAQRLHQTVNRVRGRLVSSIKTFSKNSLWRCGTPTSSHRVTSSNIVPVPSPERDTSSPRCVRPSRDNVKPCMSRYIHYPISRALARCPAPLDTKSIHQCENSPRKRLDNTTKLREKRRTVLKPRGIQVGEGDRPLDPGGWVALGPIVHDDLSLTADSRTERSEESSGPRCRVNCGSAVQNPGERGGHSSILRPQTSHHHYARRRTFPSASAPSSAAGGKAAHIAASLANSTAVGFPSTGPG